MLLFRHVTTSLTQSLSGMTVFLTLFSTWSGDMSPISASDNLFNTVSQIRSSGHLHLGWVACVLCDVCMHVCLSVNQDVCITVTESWLTTHCYAGVGKCVAGLNKSTQSADICQGSSLPYTLPRFLIWRVNMVAKITR